MCYENVVKNKGFSLDYSQIGHGCYLISTNGGTWSTLNDDLNNKVKVIWYIYLGVHIQGGWCDHLYSKSTDEINLFCERHTKFTFGIKRTQINLRTAISIACWSITPLCCVLLHRRLSRVYPSYQSPEYSQILVSIFRDYETCWH